MAGKPMLIAVDTGNHSIKTPNTVFRACYTEYDGALGGDCLVYEGKSYSICDKKFPHEDNKANFDYMLLVMIAMISLCSKQQFIVCKLVILQI